jgi:site-specific recombinase XerD
MNNLLTEYQMGKIFNINPLTLKKLLRDKKLPCVYEDSKRPLFRIEAVSAWMANNPLVEEDEDARLEKLQAEWQEQSPEVFTALRAIDSKVVAHSNAQKYPKRFSLIKRPSKHYGFLYYVRYIEKGKLIPSKWNTHTNVLQEAEQFARENRDRILLEYRSKHTPKGELYSILEEYYKAGSSYLEKDKNRSRELCEKTRSVYYHFMNKKFIPYLQENNIKTFGEINPPLIAKFQDYLLEKETKPQTINRYLSSVNATFKQLLIRGIIKENPFDRIASLKMGEKNSDRGGCFHIDKLKGIFNTRWDDTFSYLLCLVIYSTDMRNCEIEKIKVNDIIEIGGIHFIDIKDSKTENGIRLVPLHEFVYRKIQQYIKKTGRGEEDYIFSAHGGPNQSTLYKKANILLGKKLKLAETKAEIEKELKKQKISFYSGRHFWKTLMNSEDLGEDIEEFFMGHKVSGDVSKNYNHKDKQGREKLLQKTREVFTVLDKKLFA